MLGVSPAGAFTVAEGIPEITGEPSDFFHFLVEMRTPSRPGSPPLFYFD